MRSARVGRNRGRSATDDRTSRSPDPIATELGRVRYASELSLERRANEEARQRALLGILRDPILTTSEDGRVTDFNAAATALFGGSTRVYGRSIHELLPFVRPPDRSVGEGTTWHGQITDATGRMLDFEVSRTRLEVGLLPASYVYVLHDVSHYAEINRLREQLLYSVAHELRGPLGALENALELLDEPPGELSADEREQLMKTARRTVLRLHLLMEDLLSAGTIQSGRFHVRARPTPLIAVVNDAVDMLQPLSGSRGQRVEREIPEGNLYVLADERYIRQVLFNLLTNASKYSPYGAVIRLYAEKLGAAVRITVEDRGPGIPPDQQAGLFERFYRVRTGSSQPGVGLGLAIAKGIIDAHGGNIEVESEIGVGTRVWFTLPVVEKDVLG